MIRNIREARDEEGFTLIELLVVVIIIGILAAIAIPAFLNQRERAWQSELTSTVRNIALEVEAEATTNGGSYVGASGAFATNADLLAFLNTELVELQTATGPVTLGAAAGTLTDFTFCGEHASIDENDDDTNANDHRVVYDSDGGGIRPFDPTDCVT